MGVNLGLMPTNGGAPVTVKGVDRRTVNELFVFSQPAHLQKLEGKALAAKERDAKRAALIRGQTQQSHLIGSGLSEGEGRMFNKFTDRARKVMQLAKEEAQRFNHDYVGTEHCSSASSAKATAWPWRCSRTWASTWTISPATSRRASPPPAA